jgi:hypothetical protein
MKSKSKTCVKKTKTILEISGDRICFDEEKKNRFAFL